MYMVYVVFLFVTGVFFHVYVSEKGLSRQKTDVSEAVTEAFPDD